MEERIKDNPPLWPIFYANTRTPTNHSWARYGQSCELCNRQSKRRQRISRLIDMLRCSQILLRDAVTPEIIASWRHFFYEDNVEQKMTIFRRLYRFFNLRSIRGGFWRKGHDPSNYLIAFICLSELWKPSQPCVSHEQHPNAVFFSYFIVQVFIFPFNKQQTSFTCMKNKRWERTTISGEKVSRYISLYN